MQRLCTAQYSSQRLDCYAHNIVLRLLRGETDPRGLRMEAHQPGTGILCLECFAHLTRPDATCSAVFGNLFEEVVMSIEEEGKAWREFIYIHTAGDAPTHILQSIAERESQFLHGSRTRLTDMISGNGNRIPLRNILRAEFHRVDDESHGWLGWENIFLLCDEFFENIVLDGAAQLICANASVRCSGNLCRPDDRGLCIEHHPLCYFIKSNTIQQNF